MIGGGLQIQLPSTCQSTMELRIIGCKYSSWSLVEQLFLMLSYRQIHLHFVASAITRQNSNGETYRKLKRNMLLLVDIRYRHLKSSCKSFCLIFSAKFLLSGKCIFSL